MVRQTSILFLAILGFTLSAQQKSSIKPAEAAGVIVHGNGFAGVIFPAEMRVLDRSREDKQMRYWTPTESDIVEAESKLVTFLQQSQIRGSEKNRMLKDIKSYKRQYVGILIKGEKEIFINFFCIVDDPEWTKHEVLVLDGGSCFFRVNFSMKTQMFHGLQVNGYA
jgi:hypothetical protein